MVNLGIELRAIMGTRRAASFKGWGTVRFLAVVHLALSLLPRSVVILSAANDMGRLFAVLQYDDEV